MAWLRQTSQLFLSKQAWQPHVLCHFFGPCSASSCPVLISVIGCLSVRWAARMQNVFFFLKLGTIAFVILLGFIALGQGLFALPRCVLTCLFDWKCMCVNCFATFSGPNHLGVQFGREGFSFCQTCLFSCISSWSSPWPTETQKTSVAMALPGVWVEYIRSTSCYWPEFTGLSDLPHFQSVSYWFLCFVPYFWLAKWKSIQAATHKQSNGLSSSS